MSCVLMPSLMKHLVQDEYIHATASEASPIQGYTVTHDNHDALCVVCARLK